jgi:succinate-semialdehyde dehydrogenase/glutarate-semialdehyde dehydrogenase
VDEKLQRAADAFERHRRTSIAERADKMRRAGEILEAEKDRLARLMTTEMGKTLAAARAEAEKCAWVCRHYAEHAARMLAPQTVDVGGTARGEVHFLPLGAVLAVMPWNFPFWQVFRFAAPALMAGNVGLLKHASNVPGCALAIEQLFRRAGFGEGVFQTLLVGSRRVQRIIEDPRVRAVTLTGSEAAGAQVRGGEDGEADQLDDGVPHARASGDDGVVSALRRTPRAGVGGTSRPAGTTAGSATSSPPRGSITPGSALSISGAS